MLDRGNPNHARSLHRDPELAAPAGGGVPAAELLLDLSLIERLWKHLKATRVPDVLFGSYCQFERHVVAALGDFGNIRTSRRRWGQTRPKHIGKSVVAYT